MINVENKIRVVEEKGEDIPLGKVKDLVVKSHWNRNEWIVIKVGKEMVTVCAKELKSAIENATNTSKF